MSRRKPLSLREQLKANDEAFLRTGHRFGLERLARKESDPGTCEAATEKRRAEIRASWNLPAEFEF